VSGYVEHYNNVRLNSAIGYITPKDVLAGSRRYVREGSEVGEGAPAPPAGGCEILRL